MAKGFFCDMKRELSQTIIMRVREFGETDLLVTFFTPDTGQMKGVAKGARRSRRRFVNCLETFSLASLEYSLKREEGLCFLHSGRLIDAFPGLRSDFATLSKASYMIELSEILFPFGVSDVGIFELLVQSFDSLSKGEAPDLIPILFEARAMALGGYRINLERCCGCTRPYKGEGLAAFKPDRGGIACLKCEQKSALSPPLRPETVLVLKHMQAGALSEALAMTPDHESLKEIKTVLRLHREFRLEQKLKTSKYLD